jgi:hypothetical protein
VWTEAGLRGKRTHERICLLLQGDLAQGSLLRSCRPPLARLGPGGVDGHFRFHRCSSFRHGQPWEPDRQYRSHHPQPTIGQRRKSHADSPVSYCFGASVMHTHLYQGGGVVFDRRFMFPDKCSKPSLNLVAPHSPACRQFITCFFDDRIFGGFAMPGLRRFLQAGGALAPERINEMRAAFPADSSST